MKIRKLFVASTFACISMAALGWGQKGHDVTAALAEKHLTPTTLSAVNDLLDGKSIIYWANWLDNASHTDEYAYSKTWHYKNIDAGEDYDKVPPFKTGDVLTAIDAQIATLQNPEATKDEKALALKILVHLTGDLHQPMHMGHATDLGGNRVYVKFFNNNANLHSIWDSSVLEAGHKWTYTEWVDQIDRPNAEQLEIIMAGTPTDWGRETVAIAGLIYGDTPAETKVSYDYIAKWTPVIEDQLLKGGLRLSDILNSIFDPDYTPQTSAVKK